MYVYDLKGRKMDLCGDFGVFGLKYSPAPAARGLLPYDDPGDGQYGDDKKPPPETVQSQVCKLLPAELWSIEYSGICGQVPQPADVWTSVF